MIKNNQAQLLVKIRWDKAKPEDKKKAVDTMNKARLKKMKAKKKKNLDKIDIHKRNK